MAIAIDGGSTNFVSTISASPSANRTLTLPDVTGTLNTSGAANEVPAGSASTPSIYPTGDTNTGIFFPAADTIAFSEGGAEAMRIDSSGNVGIGTSSPAEKLHVVGKIAVSGTNPSIRQTVQTANLDLCGGTTIGTDPSIQICGSSNATDANFVFYNSNSHVFRNSAGGSERARITSGGDLLVGKTAADTTTAGGRISSNGVGTFVVSADETLILNRLSSDGSIVSIRQDSTQEGNISVSGTTVSYNGGHLSRWAQMPGTKDDTLLKGTVMSNLDEMNVYTDAEGNPVDNEQLNKVKVSDVEGDVNVAGVFVNWTQDEAHQVDEINMAMTGDMIIRIAQGVVVQKGDLLMSAGDGTAKPQGDDIVRSKTVAKVTSNHVTCTYEDGSYCVPCVLMAC